ncbi:hypothetical protein QA645_33670 [Bradyrhizobium sp. CIAT3101]|uniref:hypothetical protein n=1 Tax=Bradyrhizobium sp. CIAT3101 TaxID=439387 RepID=UPI0024B1B17A|nr:hypothetical protein [Bradyrhizobium sp. CIAT3101]WFU79406.1 hypothetical protein QA645_33670 [Bradyrhizobium sp. CIAT3101]
MRFLFNLASSQALARSTVVSLLFWFPGLALAQAPTTSLEREQLLAAIFTNMENLAVAPGLVTSSYKNLRNETVKVEVRAKDNCNIEYRRVEAVSKNGKVDGYLLKRRTMNLARVGAIEPRRSEGGGFVMSSVSPGFGGRKMICGSYDTKPKPEFVLPLECQMDWTGESDWYTLDVSIEAPKDQISAMMSRVIDAEKAYLTKYCPSRLASLIKEVSEPLGEKSPMAGNSASTAASQATAALVNQASRTAPPASIIDALVVGDDAALRKAMRANLPSYTCNAEDDLLRCTDGQYEVKATVAKKAFFFQLEISKDPDRFPQSRPVFQLIDRLGSAIGLLPEDINGCWRASDSRTFAQKRGGLKIACQTRSQFTKQMVLAVEPDTSF